MRTRMLLVVVLLVIGASSMLAQSKTGTTIGQFLMIEPSGRIAGMGNAGATLYGETQSSYYNPAAIGLLPRNGVQFTYSPWLADITYDYAGVGLVLGEFGNFYASVTSLNSGEIDVRTVEAPLGTGERYTASDIAVGLGYGRQISERFSLGLQVTYIQETIWHSSLSAFSFSVGTLYRISEDGLRLGASISNFGTKGKYDGRDLRILYDQNTSIYGDNGAIPAELYMDSWTLPVEFRVGLGYPLKISDQHMVMVAVDAFHPSDNTESVSFGAEWMFFNIFALRAGYQHLWQQDSEVGLTLGAGVHYDMTGFGVVFDYAWADYGRLKDVQRLTLGVTF